jgi:predicted RNase H-like nuclease (RuvC/YqgF family)
MNASTLVDIFLGILPVIVGVVTYLNAQKAIHQQASSAEAEVDAQAYDRAKSLYESVISSLTGETERMRQQSDRQILLLNEEITKLQDSNSRLRGEIIEMQKSNAELRTRVIELQASNARLEDEVRTLKENNGSGL